MDMQVEAIAEALSEQVGFTRGSINPDLIGWRDIVEHLFQDERIKVALIERYADRISDYADYADRISDYADRIDAELERDRETYQRYLGQRRSRI